MRKSVWAPVARGGRALSGLLVAVSSMTLAITEDVSANADAARHFEEHIRPILATNCVRCHGPEKQKGGLRLDTAAGLHAGGEAGAVFVPGAAGESRLISAVRYEGLEMPPDAPLSADDIALLADWIDAGAVWPEHDAPILAATESPQEAAKDWWAVQPLAEPAVPLREDDNWSRNPIDQFVYDRLRSEDMRPAPRASRTELVRRLYFDLIGLPPTPEELTAFLTDPGPDPWKALVDRLLDDPRYGEHWARFWLDLVRYAESDGWNKDSHRPNIWRYRDYVVDAFNSDKPYPEFVREQIAGDEMPGDDPAQRIATGFLRLGIYEYNQRDARGQWNDIMNEITDVTGDVFLGVSMSCSRCHDHKFDPIPQTDYFGLRAFFEPLIWRDDIPGATEAEVAAWQTQHDAWAEASAAVQTEIDALCAPYYARKWTDTVDKFPLEIQACFYKPVAERSSWEHQMAYLVERQFYEEGQPALKPMTEEDKARLAELEEQRAAFKELEPKALPKVMSVTDFAGKVSDTVVPGGGQTTPIPPQFLTVLASVSDTQLPDPAPEASTTGRRTALAEWIGNADNPLTTRLIVNRIWQQHFGQGIVATSSDFGHLGQPPSHPELLDWLTRSYIAEGWSMKHLHRLILLSATWQQSATHPEAEAYLAKDPAESLLWRARLHRLRAEELRDAMLAVSGELDGKRGGASVKDDVPRRSLYLRSLRNTPNTLLHNFDAASGLTSIARRNETTTPLQALQLFNGDFAIRRATKMAEALVARDLAGDDDRIDYAFRLAWSRGPTKDERNTARSLIGDVIEGADPAPAAAQWVDLCHVLLNANGFLYVD